MRTMSKQKSSSKQDIEDYLNRDELSLVRQTIKKQQEKDAKIPQIIENLVLPYLVLEMNMESDKLGTYVQLNNEERERLERIFNIEEVECYKCNEKMEDGEKAYFYFPETKSKISKGTFFTCEQCTRKQEVSSKL